MINFFSIRENNKPPFQYFVYKCWGKLKFSLKSIKRIYGYVEEYVFYTLVISFDKMGYFY